MQTKSNTFQMVLTAMMICLIMVSILFIRIPIPFTQGYVHLGDAMIILSVLMLGWKKGAIAAALGGMLGDLMGGFAMWAPWTFAIKGIMALVLGLVLTLVMKKPGISKTGLLVGEVVGTAVAGVVMVAGYYMAEGIMYGNWTVPLLGVPWNIGQAAAGMVIAIALSELLCKTPARVHFAYRYED